MPSATTNAGARNAPEVADIRARALDAGFDAVGIAPARLDERTRAELAAFVTAGRHGDMAWMSDTLERRGDPQALWPEARSVIVLATNYGPSEDPMKLLDMADRGTISVYARNRDYHDTVKKRLKQVARWMAETYGCQVKVFVDTAPVMEKPLAQLAGLGWQGKHTNLLSRDWGNWLFLGEIFTDLELPRDQPESEHCGSCRKCLDVCPTDAFPAPFQLDATRCISYLTIEHKGHIDHEFRAAMGNRIYGCDDCLAVCPWNKFARRTGESDFLPRLELTAPRLADLARLDDASFRQVFSKSPVKRLGRDRFVRNVLIAIGNSGEPALAEVATGLLDDGSPLVRAMAIWALRRLDPEQATRAGSTRQPREPDPEVAREWTAPL